MGRRDWEIGLYIYITRYKACRFREMVEKHSWIETFSETRPAPRVQGSAIVWRRHCCHHECVPYLLFDTVVPVDGPVSRFFHKVWGTTLSVCLTQGHGPATGSTHGPRKEGQYGMELGLVFPVGQPRPLLGGWR